MASAQLADRCRVGLVWLDIASGQKFLPQHHQRLFPLSDWCAILRRFISGHFQKHL